MEEEETTIQIAFPEKKFQQYLEGVGVASAQVLNVEQVRKIFLQMIQDFKSGNVCLDELSVISGRLWWNGILRDKNEARTKLGETLHFASELSFYVRRVQNEDQAKIFLQFLKRVLFFAEEEKSLGGE